MTQEYVYLIIMNESELTNKIEYLTNQNKFYRLKLAQAAVKIQELKKELIRKEEPDTLVDELRKDGQL